MFKRFLPFGLGAIFVLAFAPTAWFWLMFPVWALFYRQLLNASCFKAALGTGFQFGAGFFLVGVSWVYVSLSQFGGMHPLVSLLSSLVFCLFLALFPAMASGIFWHFSKEGPFCRAFFFAALFAATDLARGYFFSGFPWLSVGYSQTGASPLFHLAPFLGVYGISFVSLLIAGLLAEGSLRPKRALDHALKKGGFHGRRRQPAVFFVAAFLLCLLHTGLPLFSFTKPIGAPFTVALLQGNIAQDEKWDPLHLNAIERRYYDLMRENPAHLTVLPETAIPAFFDALPPDYREAMDALAKKNQGNVVMGVVSGTAEHYANSAISLGVEASARYDKRHLVPFGERVPFGFRWWMSWLNIPMSEFSKGGEKQALMSLSGQQVAINICYEDAFGEEIIEALPQATLLINLSNVAWFGRSLAPYQHLQMSQMRAYETGRMMLRATNTGMTAVIDAKGQVLESLPSFVQGALVKEVQGYEGQTPFARYGNFPLVTLLFLIFFITFFRKRKSLCPIVNT